MFHLHPQSKVHILLVYVCYILIKYFTTLEHVEQSETVTKMDTSTHDMEPSTSEQTTMEDVEQASAETKTGKRKRSAKKPAETEETLASANTRPRRTLTKRKLTLCPLDK